MEKMIISSSELVSLLEKVKTSGCKYVELSILEPENIDGDDIPATLNVEGFNKIGSSIRVGIDQIFAVEY